MAVIDLGKLGFVNKGTYNNSTTYEKNDLVQFTDGGILSTYLYIDSTAQSGQAPSSSGTAGSRWVYFAKGGAAGTDVAAVLNNNEIAFKTNAGALDGLAIGTAGQALKVNSGANGYEFGSAGGIQQVIQGTSSTQFNQSSPTNSQSYYPSSNKLTATITPSSTSSKILVEYVTSVRMDSSNSDMGVGLSLKQSISGGSTTEIHAAGTGGSFKPYSSGFYFAGTVSSDARVRISDILLLSPSTVSAITYEVGVVGYNTDSVRINDDNTTGRIILMEVTV